MPALNPSDKLRTDTGQHFRVVRHLGEGGQGEVHEVDLEGQRFALKWYHTACAKPDQRDALRDLVRRGAPSERFLWPVAFVEDESRGSFGYLMGLRPAHHVGLDTLIVGRMSPPPDFRTLCRAAIELAAGYRALHLKGLCYKDISFGNAFLDPGTGDVTICDNDNVCVDKSPRGDMMGTGPFMAPEIWRNESNPGVDTDRYSLAVLLFYVFVRSHPLEGQLEANINCWDSKAQKTLYGTRPVFIFDPSDASNRPVAGLHERAIRNWPRYPTALRDLFVRAFTEGLTNPSRRVVEGEWMRAFSDLRDCRFLCHKCAAENYYDRVMLTTGQPAPCAQCRAALQLPMRVKIGDRIVMLNSDTELFPHHFGADLDFSAPAASVSRHPKDPNRFGLRNRTSETWLYRSADGRTHQVGPDMSAPLLDGLIINFGRVEGQVKAA